MFDILDLQINTFAQDTKWVWYLRSIAHDTKWINRWKFAFIEIDLFLIVIDKFHFTVRESTLINYWYTTKKLAKANKLVVEDELVVMSLNWTSQSNLIGLNWLFKSKFLSHWFELVNLMKDVNLNALNW